MARQGFTIKGFLISMVAGLIFCLTSVSYIFDLKNENAELREEVVVSKICMALNGLAEEGKSPPLALDFLGDGDCSRMNCFYSLGKIKAKGWKKCSGVYLSPQGVEYVYKEGRFVKK